MEERQHLDTMRLETYNSELSVAAIMVVPDVEPSYVSLTRRRMTRHPCSQTATPEAVVVIERISRILSGDGL
jgi:hypothetical protein